MADVDGLIEYFRREKRSINGISTMPITKKFGVEYIGRGIGRIVFAISDEEVIKLANPLDGGKYANSLEYKYWLKFGETRPIAKIYKVASDFLYLISERCEEADTVPSITKSIIKDNWSFNFGRRKGTGEIVAVDYAEIV